MRALSGHTSPETAFVVEDWPYGRTLRCRKRFWVETATKGAKKGEQRIVSQTTNPKRAVETWNKPKAGTYSPVAVLYLDDEGKVQCDGISHYASEDEVVAFAEKYAEAIGEHETERLNVLLALRRAGRRIKWEIVTGSDETREEREERQAKERDTLRKLVAYELHQVNQEGGVAARKGGA